MDPNTSPLSPNRLLDAADALLAAIAALQHRTEPPQTALQASAAIEQSVFSRGFARHEFIQASDFLRRLGILEPAGGSGPGS